MFVLQLRDNSLDKAWSDDWFKVPKTKESKGKYQPRQDFC
jgi:hypothetical protein